jgi:hypothetical protein
MYFAIIESPLSHPTAQMQSPQIHPWVLGFGKGLSVRVTASCFATAEVHEKPRPAVSKPGLGLEPSLVSQSCSLHCHVP